MRDTLYASLRAVQSLVPAARIATANGTAVNLNVNKQNFRTAMLIVTSGVVTDGTHAITVEQSANGTTGWTSVDAARMTGTPPTLTSADDNVTYEIGINPDASAPYLRAVVTVATATTGAVLGAMFLLGTPGQEPVIRP